MNKIMNGVWYSTKNIILKHYTSTYNNRIYNILAVDDDMAMNKAYDHFGTRDNVYITEIKG